MREQEVSVDASVSLHTIHAILQRTFGHVTLEGAPGQLSVLERITVTLDEAARRALVRCSDESPIVGVIFDSVLLCLVSLQSGGTAGPGGGAAANENTAVSLFREQFGTDFKSEHHSRGVVSVGKTVARVDFEQMRVTDCNSVPLRGRVESLLAIGNELNAPLC
ncbi:cleavage polyadenylation factor subunit SYC1 KNAG_0M00980 [Huiozyma naganishii CBS 8797]|uniref:Pre-mRNA 3'-end-processing endonuclease polyadenylation factor C-term domain-containing protein n=1 Tax=Huiozyma naganishii (strain ATCC MYA-139 / BCRC 22969 / CBS 8797 / KCTC 17520 / NBRC 10181 / NCYC 3082 / Yp74L-3) TaxID=1071383 RepID=J7SBC2_HUIN7|nr:hypothetical protein KNAG_0M00980 [Kazachstania naganishii CBS 8797]CCK72951.1 hypothetical protein KNAG_0M00980 [Kazachstania naganishii CBS 8797]